MKFDCSTIGSPGLNSTLAAVGERTVSVSPPLWKGNVSVDQGGTHDDQGDVQTEIEASGDQVNVSLSPTVFAKGEINGETDDEPGEHGASRNDRRHPTDRDEDQRPM